MAGLASAIRIVAAPDGLMHGHPGERRAVAIPSYGDPKPTGQTRSWPAGNGVMRRPLAPPPCRPNPTDPGDAADLSIPQGYQRIRESFSRDFFASPFALYSPDGQRDGCSGGKL